MNRKTDISRALPWAMVLGLGALTACGGGGQEPILGTAVVGGIVPGGPVPPGPTAVAPTVTAITPLANARAVPVNTKTITATFSKAMNAATLTPASFNLNCGGTAVPGVVTYFTASRLASLALPAASNLPLNSNCTATVTTAAQDTSGLPLASNFSWVFTTSLTTDTTAPTVLSTINANGAVNVPTNTAVGAIFSEAMDPATINGTNFTLGQGASTIAGTITYSGVNTVFRPNSPLAANTSYTAVLSGVKDVAGNTLANPYVWTFTTGSGATALDTTPPTVTGTINANGANAVATNTAVGATFSEAMDPLTITTANIFLTNAAGVVVPTTVTYSGVNAILRPLVQLAPGTPYNLNVLGGVGGVTDLAGNPMLNGFSIRWTTAAAGAALDTTAPTVTGTINANGANAVATNTAVGATFSEAMDPLTITNANIFLTNAAGVVVPTSVTYTGVSAILRPLALLAPGTPYNLNVLGGAAGVTDLAGNPLLNGFSIRWTTAAATVALDTTAPTVTSTINANGANAVPINTAVGATFSEAMDPLTITNANVFLTTAAGVRVPSTLTYSGVNVILRPLDLLASSTPYNLNVIGGAGGVTDLAGNPLLNGFSIRWSTAAATVLDTTAPTVLGSINANGAIDVAVNTAIAATFSENIDPLTLTNLSFVVTNDAGALVPGTVSNSGVNVVFTPLSNLAPNTHYNLRLRGGANGVRDLAGNALVTDFTWGWTTSAVADTTAPRVNLITPLDNATSIFVGSSFNAGFNEGMDPLSINSANFTVAGVNGTVTFNGETQIATFTPVGNLAANTTYTATVKGGTFGVKDLAGNALVADRVWRFTTAAQPAATPTVNLASAGTFGSFGGTGGLTNTGTLTRINGNIGTIATGTSAITGLHDSLGDIYTETPANQGAVSGKISTCTNSITGPTSAGPNAAACAVATQARLDAQAAYLALAALPPGANPGANLAGLTLAPGVYTSPSGSFLIQGGNLTLDAQGDANATWVFQMATTLTMGGPGAAAPQSVILAGGAQTKNVFWQVGTFATINAGGGGTMVGAILSQAGSSFSTAGNVNPVTLNGSVLSLGGSVTLVNTVVNVPSV